MDFMFADSERHDDKMIPSSRETKFLTKDQESEDKKARASSSNATTTKTLLTPWLKSKDPRIVRVSRAFGGKDRHSKVCTVRGLRDRRVRLSVPTAIQLYDLQDRLGLNQPSRVVDWLLNVAKDDIDELPPLQGSFMSNTQGVVNWEDFSNSNPSTTRSVSKDVETNDEDDEKDQGNRNINYGTSSTNYSTMPYYHFDPSNFNFSQQITNHHHINQDQVSPQNLNIFPFQFTLSSLPSRSSAHHHVLLYPQGATTPTTQAYFPSYIPSNVSAGEFDHSRENNHFHVLSSTSQNLTPSLFSLGESTRPFQLNMTSMHIDGKSNDSASHSK